MLRYNAAILPKLALLIGEGRMVITPEPNEETVKLCEALTEYRPDARILAAAMECAANVQMTFDKTRLLENLKIKPPQCDVLVMDAQDCLERCFAQWQIRC